MKSTTRTYSSPLREAQAAATRRRVLLAAAQVFGERGYAGATLTAVADAASVSVETVKAMGPKATLLVAAHELLFRDFDGERRLDEEVADLDVDGPVDAETVLHQLLDLVVAGNARSARLWLVFQSAAGSDGGLADALATVLAGRDAALAATVQAFADRGWQPADDAASTALTLGYFIAPETHIHFVERGGWTIDAYRAWLEQVVRGLFHRP